MAKTSSVAVKPITPAAAPKIEPTAEMIQLVLASLTHEQLEQYRLDKLSASLEPLKQQYAEQSAALKLTVESIREIQPEWEEPTPPKVSERIVTWLTEQGKPATKAEITAAVETKFVSVPLNKLVEKKTLTLTGDKYSVTATAK